MVQAWRCDRCGHVWLADSKPKRCAKCKKITWDKDGAVAQMAEPSVVVAKSDVRVGSIPARSTKPAYYVPARFRK
jgi:hypothetical protein